MQISIRNYDESDAEVLWKLFFNTVRTVNIRDYSQAQVEAWASASYDANYWTQRMKGLSPFLAVIDDEVVGYTDLQADGLIDHFFCHHQFQRQGVGTALMNHVLAVGQARGIKRFYSEVSITARPFYEHHGFSFVEEKTAELMGQVLSFNVMVRSS